MTFPVCEATATASVEYGWTVKLGAAPSGACRQEEGVSFYKQGAPLKLVNPSYRGRARTE